MQIEFMYNVHNNIFLQTMTTLSTEFFVSKGQGGVEVDEILVLLQLHPKTWVGIDDGPLLLYIL